MPTCNIPKPGGLTNNTAGCLKSGIRAAAIIQKDDLNTANWLTDATLFDKACRNVLGFTFEDPAVKFEMVRFAVKDSTYQGEYTKDTDFYTHLLTLVFNGKDCNQTTTIKDWVRNCQLVMVVWTYDCNKGRLIGIDYDSEADEFVAYETGLYVERHLDTHGQKGDGANPRDEIDLGGESECPALWVDISIQDFIANYAN